MLQRLIAAGAFLGLAVGATPALAVAILDDAPLFMTGSFPAGVESSEEPASGAFDGKVVLINRTGADLGKTTISFELPPEIVLTSGPSATVGSVLWARFRGNGNPNLRSFDQNINFLDELGQPVVESHFVCGISAIDVDPTTNDVYMIAHRGYESGSGCPWRGSDRYILKWDRNASVFRWWRSAEGANGMFFLADGTMVIVGSGQSPNGRGSLHTIDTGTQTRTYRTTPQSGNSTYAFNPADGFIYGNRYCNNTARVNPSNWSYTTAGESNFCGYRRSQAYVGNNMFLVHNDGSEFRLWTVNPSNQATVSNNFLDYGDTTDSPMAGIFGTYAATPVDAVDCGADSCEVAELPERGHIVVNLAGTFEVPANSPPGFVGGTLVWKDESGTVLGEVPLGTQVIGPDASVSMTASDSQVAVGNTFTYDVEVGAPGGVDLNGMEINVDLADTVEFVGVSSSSGVCGLSRAGVRCSEFDVAAGGTETITITVEGESDGYAPATARLVRTFNDLVPSNDQASATVIVGDYSDLAVRGGIAAGAAPTVVGLGASVSVTFEVTNYGPFAVTAVGTVPLDGFELGEFSTDTGECSHDEEGAVLRCEFGDAAVGTTATVSISAKPQRFGVSTLSLTASSNMFDINEGNNTYGVKLSVTPPALTLALGDLGGTTTAGVPVVAHLVASFSASTGQLASLREVTGSAQLLAGGVVANGRVKAFHDRDGDGSVGEGDTSLGDAAVTVADGGDFRLVFDAPVAISGETHVLFVASASRSVSVAAADASDGTSGMLLGFAPLALAGLVAVRRRRAAAWALAIATLAAAPACGLVDDLLEGVDTTAQVTIEGARAGLIGDNATSLDVEGLPLSFSSVRVSR